METYLTGTEYSVETFDDQVVGICHKHLGAEPHFVEIGHDFPAPLAPDVRDDLAAATARASLRALGLGWGPAHVELRHDDSDSPRIVEVNPRLAGGMIPRVVEEAAGVMAKASSPATAAHAARSAHRGPRRPHRLPLTARAAPAGPSGACGRTDGFSEA